MKAHIRVGGKEGGSIGEGEEERGREEGGSVGLKCGGRRKEERGRDRGKERET